ncbi:MAG: ATP-binding protein, partial [Oceanobacter sp.]
TTESAIEALRKTGFEASVVGFEDLGIYNRYRLERSEVASFINEDGFLALLIPHQGKAIHIVMAGSFHKNWSRFVWWLITTNLPEFQALEGKITLLNQYTPFPVKIVYGDKVAEMFSDHPADKYQNGLAYIRVPTPLYTIVMGPLSDSGFWRYAPSASFITLTLMLLALLVFGLLSSLRASLSELDQATIRIAQGHLSARLSENASGPTGHLATSFNRMASRIQQLMGIQREMLRAVSHELRTPVARIRFGLQIIEDSTDDNFVQKRARELDSDINELDKLVDEILTYARLEDGAIRVQLKPGSVQKIAEQVVEEARILAKVEVEYQHSSESLPMVNFEEKYLHRAIQNLVSNACRYAKSRVSVSCYASGESVRIDVEDDGAGVPKEDRRILFQAFTRLDDSRTRSTGGYGLGLSIVKRIMDWHGGQARVLQSEALGGARFSLILPVAGRDQL